MEKCHFAEVTEKNSAFICNKIAYTAFTGRLLTFLSLKGRTLMWELKHKNCVRTGGVTAFLYLQKYKCNTSTDRRKSTTRWCTNVLCKALFFWNNAIANCWCYESRWVCCWKSLNPQIWTRFAPFLFCKSDVKCQELRFPKLNRVK